jgi:hypothetical protein
MVMPQSDVPAQNTAPPPRSERKRHGCLTTWLIIMVILNLLGILLVAGIFAAYDAPGWLLAVSIGSGLLSLLFIIGVFMWKKWGAYGIIAIYIISIILDIVSGSYTSIAGSVIGLSVFLMVMNMGGENRAWNYMD